MANIGQTRRVSVDFSAAGVDTDPDSVTLTITAPDGTVTTPAPEHDGDGLYHYDLLLTASGTWTITFTPAAPYPPATTTIHVAGRSPEGPCDYWLDWSELGQYLTTVPDVPAAVRDGVLASATRTMWERSCRLFGYCTIERARVTPRCHHQRTNCRCGGYSYIDLGTAPVYAVEEVWIDGVVLDPSAYRVDDWRWLVRTDNTPWPHSTVTPAQGGTGTTEITWTYGIEVPPDGKLAFALLVQAEANAIVGGDCEVPAWAERLVREGTTVEINPPDPEMSTTTVPYVERWLGNFQCGGGRISDPGARKLTTRIST